MKLTIRYKLLYLSLPIPEALAFFIVRKACRVQDKRALKALKTELKQAKKDFPKLELVNVEAGNGFKLKVRL